jgi:Zn-dependent protease with chaperone function
LTSAFALRPSARAATFAWRGGGLAMLLVTLALEYPAGWVRYKIVHWWLHDGVYRMVYNSSLLAEAALFAIAWFGVIRALLALVWPIGTTWWWRQSVGGRGPSGPELVSFTDALDTLKAQDGSVRGPRHWFVLDDPDLAAAVCDDTLMLTRGLLDSDYLTPVLAHELGHLNSMDGRLTCALNRVIVKEPRRDPDAEQEFPPGLLRLTWRAVMWFLRGGLGLKLLGTTWAVWWRQREYAADRYAKDLGQGEDLADYMETHALFYDRPVPFIWNSLHTHPPTELRIDRLRNSP